jgi:Protein of unknown function (DUF1552)
MNSPLISRRTLLRGATAALGLPMLEAMLPRHSAFAAMPTVQRPVRLAWVFFPNGTNASQWEPQVEGSQWQLAPSLEPLGEVKSDITLLRGLAQVNARSLGDGPGDHARSAAAFLTGAHPVKTSGAKMRAGKSADQYAAEFHGKDTRLASIELGTETGRAAGSCDSGYACAYSNNISWRSATQPMPKEVNPKLAFDRLFGAGGTGSQQTIQKSILDIVAEDAKQLRSQLGGADRQKLDQYFSSVRDVEQRIERVSKPIELDTGMSRPGDKPADIAEHIRIMYDLMVIAFKTDTTRIATFMLGNEGSNAAYPMIGVTEGHHSLSHHQNDADKMAKIAAIDKFFAEQFAYFVKQLKATSDGEGSLLDSSLIVYGGAIRDGNRHDHHDLPVLLAGSGGGLVSAGRQYSFARETPLNNLYLTMLNRVGVRLNQLGDSTGMLDFS